jgi:hypothetical protein
MASIDLREYLKIQAQETCRAFIIHAPAMAGKTGLAHRMERILGSYRLDLQKLFISNKKLAAQVDQFRPRDLERILLNIDVPQNVVVIDNIDFILILWTQRRKQEFMNMVDLRLKSPDVTTKTFVFMVQDDLDLLNYRFTYNQRQPRKLPLHSIKALF